MGNRAFTLAETLITLGIIGIVASLTLPPLIQKKQHKQLEAQLKKGYSSLQQAILLASEEEGGEELYSAGFISGQKDGRHLHTIIGKQFVGAEIINYTPNEITSRIKLLNGKLMNNSCPFDDGYILAAGQMDIFFETVLDKFITIDINGANKPNTLGYDVFVFLLGEGNKLIPLGSPESKNARLGVSGAPKDFSKLEETCNFNSDSKFNGFGCSYPALVDPNYFKNLP